MRPNLQEITDLVTFTEEILNGKLLFLCSASLNPKGRGERYFIEATLINIVSYLKNKMSHYLIPILQLETLYLNQMFIFL